MTVWCCSPECETLTANATIQQAAQLRKAQREYDHVIACQIVHKDKELTT